MRTNFIKKRLIICIAVILLFVLPNINATETKYNTQNNYKTQPINQDLLFSDNFNDNTKDLTKWTEIMTGGEWYERNNQLEFRKYEIASSNREGIASRDIPVKIENDIIIVECIMDTYIENYPSGYQWVGQTHVKVVDGDDPENHYIDVYYRRDYDVILIEDSLGTEVMLGYSNEFRSKVIIMITDEGYSVKVGAYSSDFIQKSIFTQNFNLKLNLFIYLNGDFSDFWWCAGFDEVAIFKSNPPTAPKISGPTTGDSGEQITFTFNSEDLDGDDIRYIIEWGDYDFDVTSYVPSGTDVTLTHVWIGDDRTFTIKARAEDSTGIIGPEETHNILIPRHKAYNFHYNNIFPNILRFLKMIFN
jgi:hypothetical protein